jgi:hypothetical protein
LESRVYAGLDSPAFHVYTVVNRSAVWTRLKAEIPTATPTRGPRAPTPFQICSDKHTTGNAPLACGLCPRVGASYTWTLATILRTWAGHVI